MLKMKESGWGLFPKYLFPEGSFYKENLRLIQAKAKRAEAFLSLITKEYHGIKEERTKERLEVHDYFSTSPL
jgi:hypothetical protein